MNSNFYECPIDVGEGRRVQLCQACGDPSILDVHESGAPTIIEGHRTRNCSDITEFVYSFLPGPFGVLIPDKNSDYMWEVQTNGLMCSHRYLRGIYVPLSNPLVLKSDIEESNFDITVDEYDYYVNPLSLLSSVNYRRNTSEREYNEEREYIWSLIQDEIPFTFEDVDSPEGYPSTEEGWRWIEITGQKTSRHVTGLTADNINFTDLTPLVGQTVVLVYPNSD